ncbi:MAG: hypothetical protein ACI8WT_005016 [Clostridium sp.]|jgi:hypothetical protein
MKNSTTIVLKSIITLFQILILFPPLLLQYLSDRKMGVMRYLIFKKDVFSKELFTTSFTFTYRFLLYLGIAFCIIFFIYSYTKKTSNSLIKPIVFLFLFNLFCLSCMFYYNFQILLSYHFFLIAFFVIIILQYVKIIIIVLNNRFLKKDI